MKVKTLFERAGFKVTDRFKVKSGDSCSDCRIKGELTLYQDDGTEVPLFHDEGGERWWLPLSSIEPVKVEPNGWIEWRSAGRIPVKANTLIDVAYRNGLTSGPRQAYLFDWIQTDQPNDIIAYRICKTQSDVPDTEAAPLLLDEAKAQMADRAKARDTDDGERSMAKTVNAFNAMFGKDLTETQGWQFMELLKMARSVGGEFRRDDFVDGAAYAALAGESASKKPS